MSVTEKAAPLVDADELSCTMCRASNAAGARFCNSCGSTLEPTPLVLSSVPAAKAAEASPASTKAFARQPSRPEEEIRCGECSTLNPPHLHLCQWCDMPLGSPGGAPASIEPPVQMERAPASLEPVETDLRPRFETPAAIVTDLGPDTQVDPLEQMPDVVPLRRGRWVPALWGIAAVAAIACGLLLRSSAPMQKAAASPLVAATSTPIALAVPAPAAAEPAAPPVAVKAPPVAAAPPAKAAKPEVPSGMGLLNTAGLSAGHRIFVNGKVVGQTPRAALVRCGAVKVRIGSAGRTHVVDVPCGNEAFVTP